MRYLHALQDVAIGVIFLVASGQGLAVILWAVVIDNCEFVNWYFEVIGG